MRQTNSLTVSRMISDWLLIGITKTCMYVQCPGMYVLRSKKQDCYGTSGMEEEATCNEIQGGQWQCGQSAKWAGKLGKTKAGRWGRVLIAHHNRKSTKLQVLSRVILRGKRSNIMIGSTISTNQHHSRILEHGSSIFPSVLALPFAHQKFHFALSIESDFSNNPRAQIQHQLSFSRCPPD